MATALALAVLAVGLVAAAWAARSMLLLAFGAVLFAVLLRSLARGLRRWAPRLSDKAAVGVVALALVAVCVVLGVVAVPPIAQQATDLATSLPSALEAAQTWVRAQPWGPRVLEALQASPAPDLTGSLGRVTGIVGGALGVVTNALVLIVGGLYLALDPGLYERGIARLFPQHRRRRVHDILDRTGERLQGWLTGQFVSMAVVGTLTGLGLFLIGMPLALLLGVIAFVVCFIPFIGPILAAIPGVLLAFTEGPQMALYALLVYVGVQQVESYLITPFVQQRTVALPPALQMVAPLVGGVLLGFAGTALATPLLVVVLTLVAEVYLRDVLGDEDPTHPGERDAGERDAGEDRDAAHGSDVRPGPASS